MARNQPHRAFFIPKRYCDLELEYRDAIIVCDNADEITVKADVFTPYVIIDTPYLLEDNCFTLKAGESRTVKKLKRLD